MNVHPFLSTSEFGVEIILNFFAFLKNGPIPASFIGYFRSFQTKKLQQIYVKKCPSSKWCGDLNPQPLEHESPPVTTRPGLPPFKLYCLWGDLTWREECWSKYELCITYEKMKHGDVNNSTSQLWSCYSDWCHDFASDLQSTEMTLALASSLPVTMGDLMPVS